MNTNEVKKRKKLLAIDPKLMFKILVILIWTNNTILVYASQIFRRFPIIGHYYKALIPVAIGIFAVLAFPYINKKIKSTDILFYLGCLLIIILTMLISSDNAVIIEQEIFRMLITVIPMYFVGICYSHQELENPLFWASLAGVSVMLLYQIYNLYSGQVINADNMDASYKVLPSILYLIYWALTKNQAKYWIIAVLGALMSFIYGTRGPILINIIYFALGIYFLLTIKKNSSTKLFYLIAFFIVIFIISSDAVLIPMALRLSRFFRRYGFSTRIFDYFLVGEITDSNGRDELSVRIIEAIKENPIFGYGIMSDRVIAGNYVHNIALEFFCDFGIFLGIVLLGIIFFMVIKALFITRKHRHFYFILMISCLTLVKLWLSGSYLIEPFFFFMLGLCVNYIRKNNINAFKREHIHRRKSLKNVSPPSHKE